MTNEEIEEWKNAHGDIECDFCDGIEPCEYCGNHMREEDE